jgi:hypothetical protein
MWNWGGFQGRIENGSSLSNPWFKSENSNAPFDQKFFLILNVAVGSKSGWVSSSTTSESMKEHILILLHRFSSRTLSITNHGMMAKHLQLLISMQVCLMLFRFPPYLTLNLAKDKWLSTWGEGNDRGMTVKSVKMWQEGKCA